jgi:signal transduction histidine kinase
VYATFRDEQARFVDDDVFWRRDGTSFPVEYSATPIRDERGETIGTVVVFRDITERRKAAERIAARGGAGPFLAPEHARRDGLGHRPRTQPAADRHHHQRPRLRAHDRIRAAPTMPTCSEVMTKIAEQAERAGEVIRHIRRFVRKEQPEMAPVAVADIFETVLVLMREDARRAGVVLLSADRLRRGPRHGATHADRAGAAEPGAQRHRGHVRPAARAARLLLGRRDGDDGRDPRRRHRPWARQGLAGAPVRALRHHQAAGTRRRLSISTGIVEAHGGRLRVDSTAGIGATFYFSLPLCRTRTKPGSKPEPGIRARTAAAAGRRRDHAGDHA